jgi:hypothetical protein
LQLQINIDFPKTFQSYDSDSHIHDNDFATHSQLELLKGQPNPCFFHKIIVESLSCLNIAKHLIK